MKRYLELLALRARLVQHMQEAATPKQAAYWWQHWLRLSLLLEGVSA